MNDGPPPLAPIVKWVGGKRQLLDVLVPLLPERHSLYCEPFLGGGAMLFRRRPAAALVNDINDELINVYQVVRDNVEELIARLGSYRNDAEQFYAVRSWDRNKEEYAALSPVERASRLLYLNKTCYNGLFRVNRSGEFNTPFGRHKCPNIVNAAAFRAVGAYLREADIRFSRTDYAEVLEGLPRGAFAYLDPPYFPVSATASFTGYARDGFGEKEQIRLKECCDRLDARGVRFMLSNSAAPFILELYSGYDLTLVKARRAVNSNAARRGDIDEVVVRNYTTSGTKS